MPACIYRNRGKVARKGGKGAEEKGKDQRQYSVLAPQAHVTSDELRRWCCGGAQRVAKGKVEGPDKEKATS